MKREEKISDAMLEIQEGLNRCLRSSDRENGYYYETFRAPTQNIPQVIAVNRFVTMGKVTIAFAGVGEVVLRPTLKEVHMPRKEMQQ